MGQLLTTPAWPPPDVATKAFYQTLKRDASVKVKRGTDEIEIIARFPVAP